MAFNFASLRDLSGDYKSDLPIFKQFMEDVSVLPLTRVSDQDTKSLFLEDKILSGTGISITKNNSGGIETLIIAATGTALTDKFVEVSSNDTTPGNLLAKLTTDTGIVLTEINDGGDEDLRIGLTLSAIDHGGLGGLSDDDHTQYLLASGTRALTGAWAVGNQDITGIKDLAVDGDTILGNSSLDVVSINANVDTSIQFENSASRRIAIEAVTTGDGKSLNINAGGTTSFVDSSGDLFLNGGDGTSDDGDALLGTLIGDTGVGRSGGKIGMYGAPFVAQASHIADPSGGATVDAEARTAIDAILVVIENIGMTATS